MNSNSVQGEGHKQTAKEVWRNDEENTGQMRKAENGSVGRTFGVGRTLLMMSQSGTDSLSSGSWEWHSLRSQSPADIGQDSDDDLSIADKDMEIFDMVTEMSEDSGTVKAGNKTRGKNPTVNEELSDSHDDCETLSLVSSVFEYDSEHENSKATSTLKLPPLERLLRTKGENSFHASKGRSLHVNDRNGLQGKNMVPRNSEGSIDNVQSMDKVQNSNSSMGRWTDKESLIMEGPATEQSMVLGYNSGACLY
jgi:hypothetical protein